CLQAGSDERNAAHRPNAPPYGKEAEFLSNPRCWPRGAALRCGRISGNGSGRLDQTVAEEARPAVAVPRRGLILMAALLVTFMPAVESTIVATAMPTIVADL